MATTKYEIFCKYHHASVNKVINNNTSVKWVQAEESGASPRIVSKTLKTQSGVENCWVRPEDDLVGGAEMRKAAVEVDNRLYLLMTDEIKPDNPKYDMAFIYDGIITTEGEKKRNQAGADTSMQPLVYYERMKRLDMTPWFLYATCASLNYAMTKAGELVNLIGKENVMIGKVVSLDQYIEIV